MDIKTIYTKTAKGLTQVNQKTQSLSRDLMKVLKQIDGKSNLEGLAAKADMPLPVLEKALAALSKDGYVKIFEVKVEPLTDFNSDFGGADDDFDFTMPNKNLGSSFNASPYRAKSLHEQVEHAVPTSANKPVAPPLAAHTTVQAPPASVDVAALAAAREKSQAEARAKAEREAQVRARLDVEARAKREAEARAIEEVQKAHAASVAAEREMEATREAENKARQALSDTRNRLTREQIAKEEIESQALAAARAKAEADAKAMSEARAKAQAEAEAMAHARVMAEAAAKHQSNEAFEAQKSLRARLKEEIEIQIRAEIAEKLRVELVEDSREEVEAAIMAEAMEDAHRILEERLAAENALLVKAQEEAKLKAEIDAKKMLAEQETRIRAEMEQRIAAMNAERAQLEAEAKARNALEAARSLALEAKVREEAEIHARVQAEMQEKINAEKRAKIEAQARVIVDAEMREKEHAEANLQLKIERQAREEAESKAKRETMARELTSRAMAEQMAAKDRIADDAEKRIATERKAREVAEAKAFADERDEEQQRNAQVARLKELNARAEAKADTSHGHAHEHAAYSNKHKQDRHILRWLAMSIVASLLIAVVLAHILPLSYLNDKLEIALSGWLHDKVTIAAVRISLFPQPVLKLENIALGETLDVKAVQGRIPLNFDTLLGKHFGVGTLELDQVTIPADAMARVSRWNEGEGRPKNIQVNRILLRDLKLEMKGLVIDPFNAEIKLDANGSMQSATATSGKWNVDAARKPESANVWLMNFSASSFTLPIGRAIALQNVSAKGELTGQALTVNDLAFGFKDGKVTGSVKANWKNAIVLNADLGLNKIKLDGLFSDYSRDVSIDGVMDGNLILSAQSGSLATLLDAPTAQGSFQAKDGSVSNIDLVQAMRSPEGGGRGGQTKFSELSGTFNVAAGNVHYERLKLVGGVIRAGGSLAVSANSTLSGSLNVDMQSNVAQDHASFGVTGNIARPMLKRGG